MKRYCLLSPNFTAGKWGEVLFFPVIIMVRWTAACSCGKWFNQLITTVLKRYFPLLKSDSFLQLNETPPNSKEVKECTWNSPVMDELDRIEKEHTCWDGFPDGLGSSVLCVTGTTINQNTFYYKLSVKWSSWAQKFMTPSRVRSRMLYRYKWCVLCKLR